MKEAIKRFWDNLTPQGKKKLILLLIIFTVVAIGIFGYKFHRGTPAPAPERASSPSEKREISLDPDLLNKSLYQKSQEELTSMNEKIEELKKEIEETKKLKTPLPPLPREVEGRTTGRGEGGSPQLPPPPHPSPPPVPHEPQAKQPETKPAVELIGGIAWFSPEVKPKEEAPKGDKKKQTVYLPPSFMEATLLSGLDAPIVQEAKGNPVPLLLRVKDLAVLPNRVKANLKGCFVIAEGYGSLADERAHLRLVSLSCLARNGQSVIDQKIKGFVVDEDGKIGLRGTVVTKMGSMIARSALAGFFGGAGDAIRSLSATMSISPLGATQTVEPGKVAQAAAGAGIATAAGELQKFYLELARQTMPVIEVGAVKTVTLVISEGTELTIKEQCIWEESIECKTGL